MPKITLTAEEEIQYLRELDQIQEMIPDLEIQIVSEPMPSQSRYVISDSTIGDEFRTFLKASNLKLSLAGTESK
jgi:hypothetical protein